MTTATTSTVVSDAFLESIYDRQLAGLQKFGLKLITDVEDEPITLLEAYAHLRIDVDVNGYAEDDWLTASIIAARQYCEAYLGRSLAPKTLELATNAFPSATVDGQPAFFLPFGPVSSIVSIGYTDSDEVAQTLTDSSGSPLCQLDDYVTPARCVPASGESWPAAHDAPNSVKVRYVAGYVTEADSSGAPLLPAMARAAMLLALTEFFINRGAADFSVVDKALDLVPNRERLGFA